MIPVKSENWPRSNHQKWKSYPTVHPRQRHCIAPDICIEILSYLPAKSLLRFRSVSTEWKSMIGNPHFRSLHLSRYSNNRLETHLIILEKYQLSAEEPIARWFSRFPSSQHYRQTSEFDFSLPSLLGNPRLFVCGHVDGMLLLHKRRGYLTYGDAILWNPSIRKTISIPISSSPRKNWQLFIGFDPSTNDYKMVSMTLVKKQPRITLEIYSLNSRSWREGRSSGCIGGEICGRFNDNKVCLGEFVYWLGYDDSNKKEGLVSFNMSSETFSYTQLPFNTPCRTDLLTVVNGSSVGYLLSSPCDEITDIWVLERDMNWSKRYTFEANFTFDAGLFGCMPKKNFFLTKDDVLIWGSYSGGGLTLYASDIMTGKTSVVSQCLRGWPFYTGAYTQSLLLLS